VKYFSDPALFWVPSTLKSLLSLVSLHIGSPVFWAYLMFMKFSVAPESSRAMASALFNLKCIKTRSVIDLWFDINTSWSQYHLISADLIRHLENPATSLHISG
jgi:hypothetical protein